MRVSVAGLLLVAVMQAIQMTNLFPLEQTNFLIIILTLALWGYGQNSVGLFYSNFFKR